MLRKVVRHILAQLRILEYCVPFGALDFYANRLLTTRLIRLAMIASLVLPCLLFGFAAWTTYRNIHKLADERLVRSLDVEQEEAIKTFELVNLIMDSVSDLVANKSADEIRDSEERLYLQLKKHADVIAAVQSIWIYGADGKTLVSSRVHPPPSQSYADRDFFQVHTKGDVGMHFGQVYPSQFDGEPFFTVSKRLMRDDIFVGVLEVSVLPSNFFRFFSAMAFTQGLQYALLTERWPVSRASPSRRGRQSRPAGENTGFRRTVASSPQGGFYSSTSPVDGVDRRYAIRRLGGMPLVSHRRR